MSADLLEFLNPPSQPTPATSQSNGRTGAQTNPNRVSIFDELSTFGSQSPSPVPGSQGPNRTVPDQPLWATQSAPVSAVVNAPQNDNDDWGDFEDATPATSQSNAHTETIWGGNAFHTPTLASMQSTSTAPATQSRSTSSFSNDLLGLQETHDSNWGASTITNKPSIRHNKVAAVQNSNVLFDAELQNDEEDDDFGDFEGGMSPPAPVSQPSRPSQSTTQIEQDLLSLDLDSQPSKTTTAKVENKLNPITSQSSSALKTQRPKPSVAAPKPSLNIVSPDAGDTWAEFADWDAPTPLSNSNKADGGDRDLSPVSQITSNLRSSGIQTLTPEEFPPTNVPPPAALLSLFPPLFSEGQKKLFQPLAAQPYQLKNRILSDPITISFLRAYLLVAIVAARIIAGRKLRWKRDTHLSQGMRIGPASSKATSGMKLTGIDKGEASKEEREAVDVVRAWRDQLGRLRSAVSAINTVKPGSLQTIPDIQEAMPVKTATQDEGGIPAPHPCALCGLKRNERVNKVDISVEDSFGEWWIDQVSMHRACRNFWEEHRESLRPR